jgi:hypothetical protein
MYRLAFRPAAAAEIPSAELARFVAPEAHVRLVFVDGRFAPAVVFGFISASTPPWSGDAPPGRWQAGDRQAHRPTARGGRGGAGGMVLAPRITPHQPKEWSRPASAARVSARATAGRGGRAAGPA